MQAGEPDEIYGRPTNLFVADFIGKANFFPARLTSLDGAEAKAVTASGVSLVARRVVDLEGEDEIEIPDGFDSMIMTRPEHVELSPPRPDGLPCTVRRAQYLGSFVRYVAECADATREVVIDSPRPVADVYEGSAATFSFAAADTHLFRKARTR